VEGMQIKKEKYKDMFGAKLLLKGQLKEKKKIKELRLNEYNKRRERFNWKI